MKKKEARVFLIFVFVVGVLLCCSGASPLINNMGTDSSVFFVVGRGMKNGFVPYRDLFDHKGLYLYVLNCLAAWCSERTGLGILILEIVFVTCSVYIVYTLYRMYDLELYAALIASFIFVGAIVYYGTYEGGNLIEEYVLALQLVSFYFIFKDEKNESVEHRPCYMFIHGVCVAIAAIGFRANMALMWGGIAIVVLVRLLMHKKYNNLIYNLLAGIVGMLVGILPVIGYGFFTHSGKDMFFSMISYNLVYTRNEQGLFQTFIKIFDRRAIVVFFIPLFISCVIFLTLKLGRWIKAEFCLMFILAIVAICLSGKNYGHYFEYLVPFLIPIIGGIVHFLREHCIPLWNRKIMMISFCFLLAVLANASILQRFTGKINNNTVEACRELLEKEGKNGKDEKILVTWNHASYYNRLGMMPSEKYFYIPGTDYKEFPDAIEAQVNSILSAKNDILVIFYEDYGNKIIYSDCSKNTQLLETLNNSYNKIFDSEYEGMELYIKN